MNNLILEKKYVYIEKFVIELLDIDPGKIQVY